MESKRDPCGTWNGTQCAGPSLCGLYSGECKWVGLGGGPGCGVGGGGVAGDEKGKFNIILTHICCLVPVEVGWVGRVRFQLFLGRSSGHKVPFMPCNGPNNYGEQGIQVFNRTLPRG
jgi:hypothetical protein